MHTTTFHRCLSDLRPQMVAECVSTTLTVWVYGILSFPDQLNGNLNFTDGNSNSFICLKCSPLLTHGVI